MAEKKTKGRQKIEIKRIEKEEDRMVAFSKRRSGINKKVNELATLTGSEVAFVVFSPAGKPFSFGNPSVESVTNRFLGQVSLPPSEPSHTIIEAHRKAKINELNQQYNELLDIEEAEKENEKQLKQKMEGKDCSGWWDTPLEGLNMGEMLELENKFKEVQVVLDNKIKEKTGASSSSNVHQITNDPFGFINAAIETNQLPMLPSPTIIETNQFPMLPPPAIIGTNQLSMLSPPGYPFGDGNF